MAVQYFTKNYGEKFRYIKGDSSVTIPHFAQMSDVKMDLIYIDGNNEYEAVLSDINNCKALTHKDTILWLDDYNGMSEDRAINYCCNMGLIKILKVHNSFDSIAGERCWVEARYCD